MRFPNFYQELYQVSLKTVVEPSLFESQGEVTPQEEFYTQSEEVNFVKVPFGEEQNKETTNNITINLG